MKIFEIPEIKFLTPITLLAESDDEAREILAQSLERALGALDLIYPMKEVHPPTKTREQKSLVYLAIGDEAGIAYLADGMWQLVETS